MLRYVLNCEEVPSGNGIDFDTIGLALPYSFIPF